MAQRCQVCGKTEKDHKGQICLDLASLACPVCGHIHQSYGFCGWQECGCREK